MTTRQQASTELSEVIHRLRTLVDSVRGDVSIPLRARFALMYRTRLDIEDIVGTDDKAGLIRGWLRDMDEAMQNDLAEVGEDSIKTDMGVTLYIHRQEWANVREGSTREQAVAALKANGFEAFVSETFNTNTLSSKVRELHANDDDLPVAVQEHIAVTEKKSIRARRAG